MRRRELRPEHVALLGACEAPVHDAFVGLAGAGKLGTTSASPSMTFRVSPACAAIHCLYRRNRALYLLVRHGFNPAGMLQLHLPRHQKCADLHVRRRLRLAHLFNRGRPVLFEVGSEGE